MAVQNNLVKKATGQQALSLTAYLQGDAVKKQINQVVGGKNGARFISSIISAYQATPALRECTNGSILNAALLGEALNLSPSPQLGQYYFVPFKNNKKGVTEATFQLGYKGLVQLAVRSGYYRKLNALAIKEGELIRYDPLEEEIEVNLIEDEYEREQAPTIGYYAMFEYENGFRKTLYWSKAKMMAHADQYSQAFSAKAFEKLQAGEIPEKDMWKFSSFWYKDFDGMAIKTMLRQIISKWGVMSIDLQKASASDGAIIRDDLTADVVDVAVDDVPDQADNAVVEGEYKEAPSPAPSPASTGTVQAEPRQDAQPKVQDLVKVMAPPEDKSQNLPGQMFWGDDELSKAFLG